MRGLTDAAPSPICKADSLSQATGRWNETGFHRRGQWGGRSAADAGRGASRFTFNNFIMIVIS